MKQFKVYNVYTINTLESSHSSILRRELQGDKLEIIEDDY